MNASSAPAYVRFVPISGLNPLVWGGLGCAGQNLTLSKSITPLSWTVLCGMPHPLRRMQRTASRPQRHSWYSAETWPPGGGSSSSRTAATPVRRRPDRGHLQDAAPQDTPPPCRRLPPMSGPPPRGRPRPAGAPSTKRAKDGTMTVGEPMPAIKLRRICIRRGRRAQFWQASLFKKDETGMSLAGFVTQRVVFTRNLPDSLIMASYLGNFLKDYLGVVICLKI